MITRTRLCLALLLTLGLAALAPASASAAAPAWQLAFTSQPTNFNPASAGNPQYTLTAINVGGEATSGPVTITATLPPEIAPIEGVVTDTVDTTGANTQSCSVSGQVFSCTDPVSIPPGFFLLARLHVSAAAASSPSTLSAQASVSGGGAQTASISTTTTIGSTNAPFGLLDSASGLRGALSRSDGLASTSAGSRPDQLSVGFSFATQQAPSGLNSGGSGVRNVAADLPPGLILNPEANARCTEAELESGNCPDASQIGIAAPTTIVERQINLIPSPLYNMVPPPGHAAEFGFDIWNLETYYVHILGGVREGNYRLASDTKGILGLPGLPAIDVSVQFWGDPSASSHDRARGDCLTFGSTCPIPPQSTPLLTMPSSCTSPFNLDASVDNWEQPGNFLESSAPFVDPNGNPTGVSSCNGLEFSPTLKARPTTNVADSPSGLDVDLHVPQHNTFATLGTAHLRKAVVALPAGIALNPSSANGLGSCSSAQAGVDAATGVANGAPVACPDNSKIGAVEVDTPLLDHPLPGAVYVATPHDNPFDSLLAIYVIVDDPISGTLIKLAGHVAPDPQTGQLITTFDGNPQLPFNDFKLEFKGGPHGVLRTPPTCGNYSTTSEMTPWSAPDSGPPATPHDDYSILQGPAGSCANLPALQPNSPSFDAGSVAPIAGQHSPFVLHLRREDGSQNFSAVSVSPPPGLVAKLAGTAPCPDSSLAAAATKSGTQEKASPSCAAPSEVGSFVAAAGAGPSPYYAPGKVYLAGPYKGAPLSFAFIAPAVAGPYDLGTVVTRAAVYVDPVSGRVTAASDPLPRILQGIPLDVRSIDLSLDRPQFSLNGTSCDPSSVDGQLTSTLGQIAPLSSPFQLAECGRLGFKPKLSIRLTGGTGRGAHPALRGSLTMPAGGANIARASIALPHSEFLDQSHIGTVCTRVQFAADDCPPASVYGSATARSPLVDYAVEGPVYLRSSDHQLPDLVMALHGPPSQPIEVDAVGRIDSVKGGIRTTFETVPDLPLQSVTLSMPGGRKGLLQNSTNICAGIHRATAEFEAQNGKVAELKPALRNGKCRKAKHPHRKHRSAQR